jgi:hypothetical protein
MDANVLIASYTMQDYICTRAKVILLQEKNIKKEIMTRTISLDKQPK